MTTTPHQIQDRTVVLVDTEVLMARQAVRKHLTRLRSAHRRELLAGHTHYAATTLRRFDDYLDLYERLGGDPDEVRDPEDGLR